MERSWKALGEFVLVTKHEEVSDYGLIVDAPYVVLSVGGFVPVELYQADIVSLNVNPTELNKVEPSNPTSPLMAHYTAIGAVLSGEEVELLEV